MKNLFSLLFVVLFASNFTNAQSDLKLNFGGLLFNSYGLQYEHVLNDEMGINATANYFQSPSSFGYEYSAFSISGDYRFYFNPDDAAEGYLASLYLKYRNTNAPEYTLNNAGEYVGRRTNGVALGVYTGRKWVSNSGFLFEVYGGIGRYLFDAESYTEDLDSDVIEALDALPAWDVRLGLVVGWRIGG